jgi:hypothetical protein
MYRWRDFEANTIVFKGGFRGPRSRELRPQALYPKSRTWGCDSAEQRRREHPRWPLARQVVKTITIFFLKKKKSHGSRKRVPYIVFGYPHIPSKIVLPYHQEEDSEQLDDVPL